MKKWHFGPLKVHILMYESAYKPTCRLRPTVPGCHRRECKNFLEKICSRLLRSWMMMMTVDDLTPGTAKQTYINMADYAQWGPRLKACACYRATPISGGYVSAYTVHGVVYCFARLTLIKESGTFRFVCFQIFITSYKLQCKKLKLARINMVHR